MIHPVTDIFMIHPQMATGHSAVMVVPGPMLPGPILGIISGLGILGLGLAKAIRTTRIAVAVRQITILHHDKFKTHKEESIDPGSHSSCGCVSDNGGTIPGMAAVNQTINSATPGYAQVPKITGSVYAGQPPKNFLKDSLKVSFPQAAEIVEKQNANGTIVTGQLGEVNGYLDGEGQDPSDAGVATVEQAVLFKLRIAIQQILRIHGYGYPLSCPTLS